MKFIIVGLGNFGSSLAEELTLQGNEVIAIDHNMGKVEAFKEKISHTIHMDATDEYTVSGLPLQDTDIIIITIGENRGANIMATALFKNYRVKRLISRAINPLHEKVLKAIGVDEIVHPEKETAERWAKKLLFKNVVDSFELTEKYSVVEINLPPHLVGKTVEEAAFREKYNLLVLTTIEKKETRSILGKSKIEDSVQGIAHGGQVLKEDDIVVLYGSNDNIKTFMKKEVPKE